MSSLNITLIHLWLLLLGSGSSLRGFPSFSEDNGWTQQNWGFPTDISSTACVNLWQSKRKIMRWICLGGVDKTTASLSSDVYTMTFYIDENAKGVDNP